MNDPTTNKAEGMDVPAQSAAIREDDEVYSQYPESSVILHLDDLIRHATRLREKLGNVPVFTITHALNKDGEGGWVGKECAITALFTGNEGRSALDGHLLERRAILIPQSTPHLEYHFASTENAE